jgi:hypothetical protein
MTDIQSALAAHHRAVGAFAREFEADRRRAITSLERLAVAEPATLAARHFRFGPMSAAGWHRWAYRHVRHHLRQVRV